MQLAASIPKNYHAELATNNSETSAKVHIVFSRLILAT